jgi:hypothetical protein
MFIELQMTAALFGRIVQERLRRLDLCGLVAQSADTTVDISDVPHLLERIEIADGAEFRREPAPSLDAWIFAPHNYRSYKVSHLQILQPVTLSLVKLADLEANGPAPSTPHKRTVRLRVNVRAGVLAPGAGMPGPVQLAYAFSGVEWGVFEGLVPPEKRLDLETLLTGLALPSTTMDLAALQAAVGPEAPSLGAINAGITCDSDGQRIALRIETRPDGDLLEGFFTTDPVGVADGEAGRDWALVLGASYLEEYARARVAAAVAGSTKFKVRSGPSAAYDAGLPGIVVTLNGEAIDACLFPVDNINLDVRATARLALSVPPGATDVLRARVTLEFATTDKMEEVGCAATAALLWPFLGVFLVGEGELNPALYLAGLAAGPAIVFVGVIAAIEAAGPPDVDTGVVCQQIGEDAHQCDRPVEIRLPGLGITMQLASVVGTALGPALAGPMIRQGRREGDVLTAGVVPFVWKVAGRCGHGFSIQNEAEIYVATEEPGRLCTVQVLDDPRGAFAIRQEGDKVTVRCTFPEGYAGAGRYACRLRLITSHGLRLITIPPPADITDAEREQLEADRIGLIASCYRWEVVHTPRDELEWLIDPPRHDLPFLQVWQIVVQGLGQGEWVHMHSPEGRLLGSASPGRSGVAHLVLMLDQDGAVERLVLELEGAFRPGGPRHEFVVQQLLYVHKGRVAAGPELTSLAFDATPAGALLVAEGGGIRRAWRLAGDGTPTLVDMSAAPSAAGQIVHTGMSVAGPEVLSEAQQRTLARLRDHATSTELFAAPKIMGLVDALFAGDRQGGSIYATEAPEPREVQRLATRPWFDSTARSGRFIVRHSPERGMIDIFVLAGSRAL